MEQTLQLAESSVSLFSEEEARDFRKRWEQVQTEFVDEPHGSVEKADQLVASTRQTPRYVWGGRLGMCGADASVCVGRTPSSAPDPQVRLLNVAMPGPAPPLFAARHS
jgi:hypothetical protein